MQRFAALVWAAAGLAACTNPYYPISGTVGLPTLSNATPLALSPSEKADIENRVRGRLKDPESAHFGSLVAGKDKDGSLVACGMVNAKNSFGGFTGPLPYQVKISPGQQAVIAIAETQTAFIMRNNCRSRGLAIN